MSGGWGDRFDPPCKKTEPHGRHTWGTGTCPGIDPNTAPPAAVQPMEIPLLERVMDAIRRENATGGCDLAARAVLHELASWLDRRSHDRADHLIDPQFMANVVRQEASRG